MKDRRAMFQNAAAIKNSMTNLKNDIKVEIPKPQPPVEEPIIEEQLPVEVQPIIEEQPIEPIEEIKVTEEQPSISLIKKKKYDEQ